MKLIKRISLFIVCCSLMVILASCISVSSTKQLEFYNQPKSEYIVNEEFEPIIVKVTMNDSTVQLIELKETDLEGFDTSIPGAYTAVYKKDSISLSFNYVVVTKLDADFSGGNGTKDDPFIITNVSQFKKIGQYLTSSFIVNADLIFNEDDFAIKGTDPVKFVVEGAIKGSIDFNNKNIIIKTSDSDEYIYSIFEYALDGTEENPVLFKNANIYVDNNFTFMYGYDDISTKGFVKYESITFNGLSTGGYNYGLLMIYPFGNITVLGCINNANIIGIEGNNAAFLGQCSNPKVKFINCVNNGNITSPTAAGFFANAGTIENVSAENCQNNGIITSLGGRGDMPSIPAEFLTNGNNSFDLSKNIIDEDNLNQYNKLHKNFAKELTALDYINGELTIQNEGNETVSYYVVQLGISHRRIITGWTGRGYYSNVIVKSQGESTKLGLYNYSLLTYDEENHTVSYDEIFPIVTIDNVKYYTYVDNIEEQLELTNKIIKVYGYNEQNEIVVIYNLK